MRVAAHAATRNFQRQIRLEPMPRFSAGSITSDQGIVATLLTAQLVKSIP